MKNYYDILGLSEDESNDKEIMIIEQVHHFSLNRRLERKSRHREQDLSDIEVRYEP